ncbi:uncharacterized protein LOC129310897 [Prosopis cineraria]|uniref:uncharacterized protein LOC129310897 n=1 Tax=Prosopis cineraria TaxID=364024 RepID=UPI00240EA675|nr:uncharacterized protein LOC129310897 [Prosopis cineraria]
MNSTSDLQTNDTPDDDREKQTPNSKTTSQAIIVFPLSYKRPSDDAIITASTSSRRKFYYHIETNVRCRSLKEVERYTLHGIRPGTKGKENEEEIIVAEKKAKETEETSPSIETRAEGSVAGKNNKGKSKIHMAPMNKNEHKILVEKFLAEAWHNMNHPNDIRSESWEEMEMRQQEEQKSMEMKLEEEREEMIRKFQEEREELERKFEKERAQLHLWMKGEIDYRIQLQLDAMLPTFLKGKNIPPPSGDSAGV